MQMPAQRHDWALSNVQGNASGALLHDQYIQSLFAAAADGLLHSPASLLGLAQVDAPNNTGEAVNAAAATQGAPTGDAPSQLTQVG